MSPKFPHHRSGITLVEVLFAIGVVLIGLVGLISVLPVAGRRAQDAIDLNEGAAMANAVFDQLRANGYLEPPAWAVRMDVDRPSPVSRPAGSVSTINPARAADAADQWVGWCIDPLFVSDPLSAMPESNDGYYHDYSAGASNGYRRTFFPYYGQQHNPLVDPSLNDSTGGPPGTNWPSAGPRMLRVGLRRGTGPNSPLLTGKEAQAVVDSADGLVTSKPEDASLGTTLQGAQATQNGVALGTQARDGAMSWIATCSPLPGTDYVSVSVVIFMKRERGFYTYPYTDGAGSPMPPAGTPEDNATAERLAYVTYANGFSGGAGGTVHVVGAENTSPDLGTGDWVMLSRQTPAGPAHRWYRVAAVTSEPQQITINDPMHGTDREVWQQKLFLDGPDWSFEFGTPADVTDDTYVTIVDDVVAVSEHVVRMSR